MKKVADWNPFIDRPPCFFNRKLKCLDSCEFGLAATPCARQAEERKQMDKVTEETQKR